jgi:hypothetical protein
MSATFIALLRGDKLKMQKSDKLEHFLLLNWRPRSKFMAPPASLRSSPILAPLAAALGIILVGWALAPEGRSQAAASADASALPALVEKLKAQQAQMLTNQASIETQTDALKEELRLAKLYSARAR